MLGTIGAVRIRRLAAATTVVAVLALAASSPITQAAPDTADVVIVGAGIAGLSAALEAARAGASVLVVDMP